LENAVLTLATRLCFVAAIALIVWAGMWLLVSENSAPAQQALVIEEAERDVGQQLTGKHIVTFRVRNTTQRPQRIIGMAEG
jgi:hypothetical protein